MPSTVIPAFIGGAVLAFPSCFLTLILWSAMQGVSPRFAAAKTLVMWALLVTVFSFIVSGIHWPAYGVLAFVGGNVLVTAAFYIIMGRRMPQRVRTRPRRQ